MCEMHSSISLGTVAKEYSESSAMILLIVLPSAAGLSLAEAIGEGGTGASPTFLLPPLLPLLPEWPDPALETGLDRSRRAHCCHFLSGCHAKYNIEIS